MGRTSGARPPERLGGCTTDQRRRWRAGEREKDVVLPVLSAGPPLERAQSEGEVLEEDPGPGSQAHFVPAGGRSVPAASPADAAGRAYR